MDILCFKMQFPEDAASNEEMKYNEESNEKYQINPNEECYVVFFFFF